MFVSCSRTTSNFSVTNCKLKFNRQIIRYTHNFPPPDKCIAPARLMDKRFEWFYSKNRSIFFVCARYIENGVLGIYFVFFFFNYNVCFICSLKIMSHRSKNSNVPLSPFSTNKYSRLLIVRAGALTVRIRLRKVVYFQSLKSFERISYRFTEETSMDNFCRTCVCCALSFAQSTYILTLSPPSSWWMCLT